MAKPDHEEKLPDVDHAKGKFRLLHKAYINDRLMEEGTEIGEGTPFPIQGLVVGEHMEPLDDHARKRTEFARARVHKLGGGAPTVDGRNGTLGIEAEAAGNTKKTHSDGS